MRVVRLLAKLKIILASLTIAIVSQPTSAQSIEGNYDLFEAGHLNGEVVAQMQIFGQHGNEFSVRGSDGSWSAHGRIQNGLGFYNWQFTDGKSGRTTFSVDLGGNLQGSVAGSGIDWAYVGHRREGPIRLAQAGATCGRFANPEPNGVMSYIMVTNSCTTTQDCWVKVNRTAYQTRLPAGRSERIDVGVLSRGDLVEKGCKPVE